MLSQGQNAQTQLSENEVWDSVSRKCISYSDGAISLRDRGSSSPPHSFRIPHHPFKGTKPQMGFRFLRKQSQGLLVSPSGRSITCKSDKIQDVEMNISCTEGLLLWSLHCSGNCLGFTVGVRNVEKKIEKSLDFTVQSATRMDFRLDTSKPELKGWAYKSVHKVEKSVKLPEEVQSWVPFVRVKGIGVTILLSDIAADPEGKISNFNIFPQNFKEGTSEKKTNLEVCEKVELGASNQKCCLSWIDKNTLLLQGKQEFRVIRRNANERNFPLNFAYPNSQERISVPFSAQELHLLHSAGVNVENWDSIEDVFVTKSTNDWIEWGSLVFNSFDAELRSRSCSRKGLIHSVYCLLLSKFESFRYHLGISLRPISMLENSIESCWGVSSAVLPLPEFSCPRISRETYLNNLPPFAFKQNIKSVLHTEHFLIVVLQESSRLCIINREDELFRLAEISLKRGFKKEYELNEYQKELDKLRSSNSSEPSIYKILKNCLKYADKVKPPQKIVKKMEVKDKENKDSKKPKSQFIVDATLLNQLISMGFSEKFGRKALTECKNLSLEAAVELIVNKYSQEQVHTKEETKEWSCALCTFINDKSANLCAVCESPRPEKVSETKEQEKMEEVEEEIKEELIMEDIESSNIEKELEKVFAWELDIAYCPLLLAGVFQKQVRLRLFGPNPKYYSNFYHRDEDFLDLSNLTGHEEAYMIDQKPVRYQFFLNSSTSQLKQAAYGWINIEDQDLQLSDNDSVENITFSQLEIEKGCMKFGLSLSIKNGEQTKEKFYHGKITISQIYAEKQRALFLEASEKKLEKEEQQQEQDAFRYEKFSTTIPSQGYLELHLSCNENVEQSVFETKTTVASVSQKICSSRPFLPVVSTVSNLSLQISYPLYALQHQVPLILESVKNKSMMIESIVIQKSGKSGTNQIHSGQIYFSNSKSLEVAPLKKYTFELEKGKKKFCIELNQTLGSKYIFLRLNSPDIQNDLALAEELNLMGVIGEEIDMEPCQPKVNLEWISPDIRISKDGASSVKILATPFNSKFDLTLLEEQDGPVLEKATKSGEFDLLIRIESLTQSSFELEHLEMPRWIVAEKIAVWGVQTQKPLSSQSQFQNILNEFMGSAQTEALSILNNEKNKEFRHLLKVGKYNMTDFLETLLKKKIDRNQKRLLIEFVRKFGMYFKETHHQGLEDFISLSLSKDPISLSMQEVLFEFLKYLPTQERALEKVLTEKIKKINQNSLGSKKKYNCQFKTEQTGSAENLLYNRILMKKGKISRTLYIDLLNVYDVSNVVLTFEKSQQKTPMLVQVSTCSQEGHWRMVQNIHYPEHVWEQLSVCSFSEEMEKNIKNASKMKFNSLSVPLSSTYKTRYLRLTILFKPFPAIPSAKELERTPQSEIIPEVFGQYSGESSYILPEFASIKEDGLVFVRTCFHLRKYTVSSQNMYLYDSEHELQKEMSESVSTEVEENSILNHLLDDMSSRSQLVLEETTLKEALMSLYAIEKGKTSEKVVAFLKKAGKQRKECSKYLFKQKFPSESIFHAIFRETSLKVEEIFEFLSQDPTETMIENASFFARSKDEKSKLLFEAILPNLIKMSKVNEIMSLHQRHGWVKGTEEVIAKMVNQGKKKEFKSLLESCKQVGEICATIENLLTKLSLGFISVGMEELISRKATGPQLNRMLISHLKQIQKLSESCSEEFEEQLILEHFNLNAKILNRLNVTEEEVIGEYIKTFEVAPAKESILHNFFSTYALKKESFSCKLIELSLSFLEGYLRAKGNRNQKQNKCSLLMANEFLIFVFRNESDLNENSVSNWKIEKEIDEKIVSCLSRLIMQELSVGGEENTLLSDSETRVKISIAFSLSILASRFSGFSIESQREQVMSRLVRWLFINSENRSDRKSGHLSQYQTIEASVWKIVEKQWANIALLNKVVGEEFEKQNEEIGKIQSVIQRNLYERRLFEVCNNMVAILGKEASSSLISQNLFERMMRRVISLEAEVAKFDKKEGKQGNECEEAKKQLANEFRLLSDPHKEPKDWLAYKNGSKDSVYKFEYPKNSQHAEKEIVLKLDAKSVNLSTIMLGFEQISTEQETYCIPAQIEVEAGQSLDDMKFIGKMNEIPDNYFVSFSVRIFGLACNKISSLKLASSLNHNPDIVYLKFKIKCPKTNYAINLLNLKPLSSKTLGSSINFLSIQGYQTAEASYPQIESLVNFIKIVSLPEQRETLKELLRDPKSINCFKESLSSISMMMKNNERHEQILHKFIMCACEVNSQIGNETIEKYLKLANSTLCSKIVTEVILSSQECLAERIEKLHQFIDSNLKKDLPVVLEPFLERSCQLYSALENRGGASAIKLSFSQQTILNIIQAQQKSEVFAKYLCKIFALQHPFIQQGIDQDAILNALDINRNQTLNGEILEALVISNKAARSWFMQKNKLEELYQGIIEGIKSKSSSKKLENDLRALQALCLNSNIKSLINKNQYNLKIFELLVSDEYNSLLIDETNITLREIFVDFISKSVLGSENEKVIALMLKKALTGKIVEVNQHFVGQVFLPILNSFSKTLVCMLPYDSHEKKILFDASSVNIPKKKEVPSRKQTSKFRLPSNIIHNDRKEELFNILTEKVGLKSGNFNLAANHLSDAIGMCEPIENSFLRLPKSLLLLFKLKPEKMPNKPQILGIYYHHMNGERNLPLMWNKHCAMFTFKEEECLNMVDISGQEGKKMIEIHKEEVFSDQSDYSCIDEKVMEINYNNNMFVELSFNDMEVGASYFGLNQIKKTEFPHYVLESAEYWVFQPSVEREDKEMGEPSFTQQILSSSQFCFFEKSFESKSSARLLRYDPIYELPTSLTMRELKMGIQVLKCKVREDKSEEVKLLTTDLKQIMNDTTISDSKKKMDDSAVMDIICDVRSIGEYLDFNSSQRKRTEYLPKKGILRHFEENDGVKSMIKVIKKSIESWDNKERKEKWLQYVLELEKFSEFPHFFGMYLKDSETFDLLFKLLSGAPNKEQDKKWDEIQSQASQKLLKIVAEILNVDKTTEFREYSMKHDFFFTILERLRLLTGLFKREYQDDLPKEEEEQVSPSKMVKDDGTKEIKKKKGVGYGNQTSSNTKWMKGVTEAELKKEFEVTGIILNIIENFLDLRHWKIPKKLFDNIFESAFLPYLEDSLRAGTLLEITKHPTKFKLVFKIIRTISRHPQLVSILIPIPKNYQPPQIESIQSLMKSLENNANIFISCLKQNQDTKKNEKDKISEELAEDILETCRVIEQAIEDYMEAHQTENGDQQMKNILELPLDKKYRMLMKDLRFDYIDMKEGTRIKHHYSGNFVQNYVPNQNKMIRLAQELADISTALPYEHTNAVYVRCDKDRVDFMQALIMGSNGTPYGHGAFLFDVYFDDNYPNGPPKVNLTTTGHGKVRFNPNLYACGKVCLSLLGTWRGSASENWDPKVSTLLQVLLSIQAIIMSDDVYFNEPGFEGEQGTTEGEKKNEAYSNIVRYSNLKFAMLENIRNPPKGFETVIKRHFYLKQHEVMEECKKWQLYAEKRQANYVGLVNDHNNSWSTQFKKSKTQYKEMLDKVISELEEEFKKLPVPSIHDITSKIGQKKQKKKKDKTDLLKKLEEDVQEEIDVAYETKDIPLGKEIDINDESVKDRWSRYIGAMGIDAVSKQSKADIMVCGLGPMALEAVKNLVLSGCRKLTICDDKCVSLQDLSGGFFYSEADVGKNRVESILHKIRELNIYVKIDSIREKDLTEQTLKTYHLVLLTELPLARQYQINQICRINSIKFISADCQGAYCRLLNDFGDKFEVLDKNGEEPVEVIIKNISNEEKAVVTLLDGVKHPFEDGEAVLIKNVQGMKNKEDPTKSINESIHKIKVINSKSFQIGSTLGYDGYIRNGTAKNIKTPIALKFKNMKSVFENPTQNLPIDDNMSFYDFVKMSRNLLIHSCFMALDLFRTEEKRMPSPWDLTDAEHFFKLFSKIYPQQIKPEVKKYVHKFCFTCAGQLPPLAAYFGGFISQQIIKAITQKFKPLHSTFYMDAEEIIPVPPESGEFEEFKKEVFRDCKSRERGFEIVVGKDLVETIKNSKLFMIGAGAIGCELLKNFAMINLGVGEKGKITLTDPDHIENSNLNRQFLFREKHISKPKSRTAAASILLMNPNLKGHISSLLERVSEDTKNIFNNNFFESLTIVANALDNVAARRYVDQRCVENKVPLFESGTLGPKGHTQVIIPFLTESYGSQNDPVEDGEIPHCTLKMFPEETLHCIEWARDIFGKKFSLQPKAFMKIKDPKYKPEKDDIKSINDCIMMAEKGPRNFEDCLHYATQKFYKYFRDDIIQLLYTYPLDAKTKDGEPFWKLPKRPPTPILKLDPQDILHCTFIASMAVLVAKIYKIPFPKNFREEKEKLQLGKEAAKIKIPDYVPSDDKAKAILKESEDKKEQSEGKGELEKKEQSKVEQKQQSKEESEEKGMEQAEKNEEELFEEFKGLSLDMQLVVEEFEKDDDKNGHIDFIYSMANLRASNYKLDRMDWITTKLKAGRIVPALATTTTCVAGLQTLQICKYLRKLKLECMRNSFLNLAVPSLQMSEPGEVKKMQITEKLSVNLWDRWEVKCEEDTTFEEVYKELRLKYGLHPIGVLQGMSRIDSSKGEEGKKEFLMSKVTDRLDREEDYIDIVVLFRKNEEDEKMVEHVPPVRLRFPKS